MQGSLPSTVHADERLAFFCGFGFVVGTLRVALKWTVGISAFLDKVCHFVGILGGYRAGLTQTAGEIGRIPTGA